MDGIVIKLGETRDLKDQIKKKQDEFLDVYSLYKTTGLAWIKQEAVLKAYELHILDKDFTVEI